MTSTKKRWLAFVLLLCTYLYPPFTYGQLLQKFQVFKLENKIGTEEIFSSITNEGFSERIIIRTKDRGQDLLLTSDLIKSNAGLKYSSKGHTSRFKEESLDTLIASGSSFPLSQNGSMKLREMLVAFWIKAGRPATLKSAFDTAKISIKEISQPDASIALSGFTAFQINHGLDEIFWTDKEGKSVFLTTLDSEGDKREVIAEKYVQLFNSLNHQSTQYLLQAYKNESNSIGKLHDVIVISGGNIIDITGAAGLQKNTMVIIKNNKIDYVGEVNKSLIPAGAKIINATDKFLIPGLWDMHAHVFHPSYLKTALLSGVTTVRDMGNEFDFLVQMKNLISKESVLAPKLYAAGLLDGKSLATLGVMLATNDKETKANVKRYHDAGFDQIKVYSSVRKDDFNTIVAEAKRYNMQVVGHLPSGYTLNYFINNGLNSLSHIHYFRNNLKLSSADLVTANKDLLDAMIAKHTYLDPTLNVYRLMKDKNVGSYAKFLKVFADYGIPIMAGTDNEGTIPDEIQSYVKLGLSPLAAIRAATIVSATFMGAAKESGSIEKGKTGDVIILDENPLLNIGALQNIRTVVRGQFVIDLGK
jgi:imidazolonepropionase-like amidohydrolase